MEFQEWEQLSNVRDQSPPLPRIGSPHSAAGVCVSSRLDDGGTPGGIPEGAVLQLDPKLDLAKFDLKLLPAMKLGDARRTRTSPAEPKNQP